MERSVEPHRVGDKQTRYVVKWRSDLCHEGSRESAFYQDQMLRILADQPEMRNCGPAVFQRMKMYHDGTRWVIETEATSKNP